MEAHVLPTDVALPVPEALTVVPVLCRNKAPGKGVGVAGRPLKSIYTNAWQIRPRPNAADIHMWDVEVHGVGRREGMRFDTDKKCVALNRRIMREMQKVHRSVFGDAVVAYDGQKLLLTKKPLNIAGEAGSASLVVELKDESGTQREAESFHVSLRFIDVRSFQELTAWYQELARNSDQSYPQDVIQALDLVARAIRADVAITAGRNVFDPNLANSRPIHGGFHIWRGWYQSIRPAAVGMVLNVELAFSAFLQEGSGLNVMQNVLGLPSLQSSLRDSDVQVLSNELAGCQFYVQHTRYRVKARVAKIDRQNAQTRTFTLEEGGRSRVVSVADYFREKYSIRLSRPDLPLIVVKKGATRETERYSYFPFEIVTFGPGAQRRQRMVTPRQAQDVIRAAAVRPNERIRDLKHILTALDFNKNSSFASIMEVNPQPLKLPKARLLDTPDVLYGPKVKGGRLESVRPRDGAWNVRDTPLFAPDPEGLHAYGVICTVPERVLRASDVIGFFKQLSSIGERSMYRMAPPDPQFLNYSREDQTQGALEKMAASVAKKFGKVQLIFVLTDRGDPKWYQAVKTFGDTRLGVVTQVVKKKNVEKKDPSTCANIILKLNAKVGMQGKNHVTAPPRGSLRNAFEDKPFMVLGADVTHPHPGSSQPSISALVGSVDRNMARYAGEVMRQENSKQELITSFRDSLIKILDSFEKIQGGRLPESIVMFRDGVGEGMQDAVLAIELDGIRQACIAKKVNFMPKITYLTVNKRHKYRFFASEKNECDRNGNVFPGTVVDDGVVNPMYYEFFLTTAVALQGTAKPSLYRVLYDELNFTPDQIQNLAMRLCFSYARCTKSVGVCAPTYYAHQLAFRGRAYAGDDDDVSISSSSVGGGSSLQAEFPSVHVGIKHKMFYC
ncbi:Protein argonaute-3 [Porphyridium purpureum]|uniref:Protein argonaute-3 n=1 Tax=Porphyridium purpureum TaxID=35688 RepID=A0A5J4Z464_PORPP|nr:Protein argonaute-3 [Porphyridium purpureum]|eukprot:POR7111..scf295_1